MKSIVLVAVLLALSACSNERTTEERVQDCVAAVKSGDKDQENGMCRDLTLLERQAVSRLLPPKPASWGHYDFGKSSE